MPREGGLPVATDFMVHAIDAATGSGQVDFTLDGVRRGFRIGVADMRFVGENFGTYLVDADLPGLDPANMVKLSYEAPAASGGADE